MALNRRTLLAGFSALTTLLVTPSRAYSTPSREPDLSRFTVYAGGMRGRLLTRHGNPFGQGNTAVLSEIPLNDSPIRQTVLETYGVHAPLVAADLDRIALIDQYSSRCLLVDMDHKTVGQIMAPKGFMFGGHGVRLNGTSLFVATLYHRSPKTKTDTGLLMVTDLTNGKIQDIKPSYGLQPHDMDMLPRGGGLVLAHRGSTLNHTGDTTKTYQKEVISPGLTVLATDDLSFKKFVPIPHNAEVSHLAVRPDGQVLCCLNQKLNTTGRPPEEANNMVTQSFDGIDALLDEIEVVQESYGISLPLPGVLVNLESGKTSEYLPLPAHQRQGQSVAVNSLTGIGVISYVRGSGLLFMTPDGKAKAINSRDIGLDNVTGLADLPGTPYMAMCGFKNDLIIVDVESHTPILTRKMAMLGAAHLSVVAT